MSYKLRAVLHGHELDVRSVLAAAFPEGSILTASRDQTCRLWTPSGEDGSQTFIEKSIFTGHSKYVASVCQFPPSEKYPTGLVVTGGHDNLILMFTLDSNEPVMRLEGHTGAVCSLKCGKYGTLLSGSWDKTARVWVNGKSVMTLSDHEAAVWCVEMMPDHGLMLTASADKMIKLWKAGQCERTYVGHTDCVRSLAVLSMEEFLSCGNDTTVRRWHVTGECTAVYEGHGSFVYSISALPNQVGCYVTSGEDRSVKVWKDGECHQTITMPCQSVWSVACLLNGDIIVGTSDGIVRVFSADASRYAAPDVIEVFETELANQAIPAAANLDLGEIKIDQLPGPEALHAPGSGDGKPRLIKRNGVVEAYQWDTIDKKWQKIGDVVGKAGAEGASRQGSKQTFEGKEYDFVFDVDIEEGKPPLKLPFNLTEDPYTAAHKFLEKNNLSPSFLDQVAHFVIDNTKGFELGAPSPAFADPFTGGSRYVPGGSGGPVNEQAAPRGTDPFTGGSRYVPGGSVNGQTASHATTGTDPFTGGNRYVPGAQNGVSQSATSVVKSASKYFPQTAYVFFDAGKALPIISKLKEFNQSVPESLMLTAEELLDVSGKVERCCMSQNGVEACDQLAAILDKLLSWPNEMLLPGLDAFRILIRDKTINSHFFTRSTDLIPQLLQLASNENSPINNQMLVFRIIANSFSSEGVPRLTGAMQQIFEVSSQLYKADHKTQSVAIATILLNFSVLFKSADFEVKISIATAVMQCLQASRQPEAIFRLMVALGTLCIDDADIVAFAKSFAISDNLTEFRKLVDPPKVGDCANDLLVLLTN